MVVGSNVCQVLLLGGVQRVGLGLHWEVRIVEVDKAVAWKQPVSGTVFCFLLFCWC